jgi:hypothetical protein
VVLPADPLPARRQVVPTPTSRSLGLPPSPGEGACVYLAPVRWRWDDAGVEEVVAGAEGSTRARRLATAFPAPMPRPRGRRCTSNPLHRRTGNLCRMDLPGPTTSVGTRTDYSVGPWDYPA